jgi:hypothetical protein
MEFLYRICCPSCGHTIDLLETSLKEIIRVRRLPQTAEPFLVFVCQGCKAAFQYDYQQRVRGAAILEAVQTKQFQSQTWFSVVAGCDHYDHDEECDDSLVELLAVRPAGTNRIELSEKELPTWSLSGIHCVNGHPILRPDPTKAYEHSDIPDEPAGK